MGSRARLETVIVLADAHVPEHDRPAWRAALALVRRVRPTVIVLAGDFLELRSCSMHGDAFGDAFDRDVAAGREALRDVVAAGRGARIVYLEGNHESRLTRYLTRSAPPMRDSLSLRAALQLDELGIAWVGEQQQPWRLGRLRVTHGHQCLGEGGGARYHAARMADREGESGCAVVYGHTHKPQTITRIGREVARAVGLGCLRTLDPRWLHGAPAGWEHGVAVAYVLPSGVAHVQPVEIRHGVAVWDGELLR